MGEWGGIRRFNDRPSRYEDEFESPTFLDSKAFIAYCAVIEQVIHTASGPLSTRAIHQQLGGQARYDWTADALDLIPTIESFGLLPTRYRPKAGDQPRMKIPKSEQMKWLFPQKDAADART